MRYARSSAITRRHADLYSLVQTGMYSSVGIAEKLGVSEQTIYRDILFLKGQGHPIRSMRTNGHWAYVIETKKKNSDRRGHGHHHG